MKKFFTSLLMCCAVAASAQYLPNSSFENWKGSAGSSYQSSDGSLAGGSSAIGLRQRPGDEPEAWNGSSVNQKVMMEKKQVLIEKQATSYSGSAGSSVKMTNAYVGVMGIGSNAPAFINFGTPWVYAISTVDKCDGGVYGGIPFSNRPDAIEGWYKRTKGNAEEKAHIIVYMWSGTFKSKITSSASNDLKDDVDRAVMGKVSNLQQSGSLVASCDYEFTTTGDGWQKITVPLDYVGDVSPEKVNVIISSGDYWNRGNIQNGSVLEVDDVQFVYYSELASLVYDGKDYFVPGKTSYVVNAEYDDSKLSLSSNGKGAVIEKLYNSSSKVLTIKIKGNDYAANSNSYHTYTVNFKGDDGGVPTPNPEPTPGGVDYTPSYTGVKSREGRWIENIQLMSEVYADDSANALVIDNSDKLCYNDCTGVGMMKAAVGETVTLLVDAGEASWMNAFVYIDTDADGFTAGIAEGSNYLPTGDLVSYSFYNNNASSDERGWNSVGASISGDARSTLELPSFAVPAKVGTYRVRVKLDWCNIDPAGDSDGKFGDFMDNGGQIVDFMLEVVGDDVVEPDPEPTPGGIDYTPSYTGVKSREGRWVESVVLMSEVYADDFANALVIDNSDKLCYNDCTGVGMMKAAVGETVTLLVDAGEASWMNAFVYIDTDADGFTAGIAEGSNYLPTGDLVSYSFYNNNASSDERGWNSVGASISGDARSTLELPSFAVPAKVGTYRVRVKLDWCNIDPAGDSDGKFGDFMDNGGQIVDFVLNVISETSVKGIGTDASQSSGIYDLSGRKIEKVVSPGLYIIDGRKVYVK